MNILTLELFDVTVSRALLDVKTAMDRHPGIAMRILVDADEMLRLNLLRFLERQGRPASVQRQGAHWQLDVPGIPTSVPPPREVQPPAPQLHRVIPPPPSPETLRPMLLLRSAFAPGDRALGRQLLLGVLERLEEGTPWILLAHEALELLEDPRALETLQGLRDRGIPVRLSRRSQEYLGHFGAPFEPMEDAEWQSILARGGLTVL
jgi:hypothetical protein